MSDGPNLTEILLSQLGSPRDHFAEWLGAGIVMLGLLAYLSLKYGLGRLLVMPGRAIIAKWRKQQGSTVRPPQSSAA